MPCLIGQPPRPSAKSCATFHRAWCEFGAQAPTVAELNLLAPPPGALWSAKLDRAFDQLRCQTRYYARPVVAHVDARQERMHLNLARHKPLRKVERQGADLESSVLLKPPERSRAGVSQLASSSSSWLQAEEGRTRRRGLGAQGLSASTVPSTDQDDSLHP